MKLLKKVIYLDRANMRVQYSVSQYIIFNRFYSRKIHRLFTISNKKMKILVIGGGNMGQTYTQSFLRSHIASEENMMILEKSPEIARHLTTLKLGTIHSTPHSCLPQSQLIILAVKPQ